MSQTRLPDTVTIAGAGLAGALLAVLRARRGDRVTLLERRPDPRQAGAEAGRSINLALSTRGLTALDAAGLREAVEEISLLLPGRLIHDRSGNTVFQPYGRSGQGIRSVHRADLNTLLLDAAERAGARIRFGVRVRRVDLVAGSYSMETEDGVTEHAIEPEGVGGYLVGADGAFSAVRGAMERLDRFDTSRSYLTHGYKELEIPPGADGSHLLEPHAMHIWPRGGYMMMAMANRNGSFTVTLYLPFDDTGFGGLTERSAIEAFFQRDFPDAVPLLPGLADQFLANPTGSLVTVRCRPWSVNDRVVLVGDACHAVVPFYGQGANAAFEDCLVLDECLESVPDRAGAFREYERRRKEHTDALADLAIANFIEMRDTVASRLFQARKRLERLLHRLFPSAFLPLYTMVSFTRVPYASARRRARLQWRVVIGAGAALAVLVLTTVVWMARR